MRPIKNERAHVRGLTEIEPGIARLAEQRRHIERRGAGHPIGVRDELHARVDPHIEPEILEFCAQARQPFCLLCLRAKFVQVEKFAQRFIASEPSTLIKDVRLGRRDGELQIDRRVLARGELVTHWFDPFCPKAATLVGTDLPEALISRSIILKLWKMKEGETVEKISQFNLELMDAFKTLRRKLQRWANDHAETLKTARPAMPAAFINRPADNWILIWAIADTADGEWGQLARNAAERLSEEGVVEPTWLERLVDEFWIVFVEKRRKHIPSEELIKQMTADELSIWHEYGRGHTVTQREVAALLRKKLHIHPRGIAVGKRRVKGYYADDFFQKQIFERILSRDPLLRSRSKTAKRAKAR